jgi:hypothetical protein
MCFIHRDENLDRIYFRLGADCPACEGHLVLIAGPGGGHFEHVDEDDPVPVSFQLTGSLLMALLRAIRDYGLMDILKAGEE